MAAYIKTDAFTGFCIQTAKQWTVTDDTSRITSTPLNVKASEKAWLWPAVGESSVEEELLSAVCVVRVRQRPVLVKCVSSLQVPAELW